MGDDFKIVVKGTDWSELEADLTTATDLLAFGQVLSKDIADRIRRGVGTDNRPLPQHHVKIRKIRERWEKADGGESGDIDALPFPISVIQQLRTLGGHTELPAKGTTWRGWDNLIQNGTDARANLGETVGAIRFYQWDSRESFLRSNYGAHVGVRTGEMLKKMTIQISRTKGGKWWLKIGPKGRNTRNMPMFRILQEADASNDKAQHGRKPRKFPASMRMALLQRMGPGGKIAESEDVAIGVLEPSDTVLSAALQGKIVSPMMKRVTAAPEKVVKA
ncbi:hypothetical protein HN371_00170 [Candidatus Poribacteria bacterium]|jgi:hypothetical protein|nr:hypothetical protein [Candidatus Poribacteria bacterium]MBT7097448.1 hypothetical protein [Candidatus Poribacteria bacterium]